MEGFFIWPLLFWVLFPVVSYGRKLLAHIGFNVAPGEIRSTSAGGRYRSFSVMLRWICLSHCAYGAGLVAFGLMGLALEATIGTAGTLAYVASASSRAVAYVFAAEYVAVALAPSNKKNVALAMVTTLVVLAVIATIEQQAATNYRAVLSSVFTIIAGGWRLWANVHGQDIMSLEEAGASESDE